MAVKPNAPSSGRGLPGRSEQSLAGLDPIVPPRPKVLVLEPDDAARQAWITKLETFEFRVVPAQSREEALKLFSDDVDLAVVPVVLQGDDGPALTRELKDRAGPGTFLPVVMIGGSEADHVRAFEAGCDELLEADVPFFELDARIRTLLDHRWHYQALADANLRLLDAQIKKKELAQLVVHDLRNPLSALQGNLDLIYEELAADTRVAGIIADSQELSRKALSMVASILDVEELEAGLLHAQPHPVLIGDFFRRVSRHHLIPIEVRKLDLVFDVDDALEVDLDTELVARVIENLLDNAVRYAPVGGKVALSAALEDGNVVLRVGNDGPPVPEEDRARIFDRYYRIEARRAGQKANRGLGLYFCQLVADAHGGSIEVEALPELPACFTLRIPQPT